VLPATHLRIIQRLFQGISVPFKGEPLRGLQVMGPLETRALDFRYLVILSANEGVFPRHNVSSSFIPPELRKGFGLPTYEFQDAVWAYYFYRMIQRPEHVWLVYDSRTEGLKSGEESRYIKQLEYAFGVPMERLTAVAPMQAPKPEEVPEKTQEHIDALKEKYLSASALKNYMDCPARFYYQSVKGLKSDDEVPESLDSRMLGIVFHSVMQNLYGRANPITPAMIDAFRNDDKGLRTLIREKVKEEMHSFEVTGRNLVLEEVILDYVKSTLRHDANILAAEGGGSPGFNIIGLEEHYFGSYGGFKFHGFIDRLDSYRNGEVRVVDYKTGKVEDKGIDPKIEFQLFIYDLLCHQQPSLAGKQLVNSIYSIRHIYTGSLPDMPEDPVKTKEMTAQLDAMLSDITNLDIPWSRTEDKDICAHCDFKDICGR
jgi:RecB family exonuclease